MPNEHAAASPWRFELPPGWAEDSKRRAEESRARCEAALAAIRAKYEGRSYISLGWYEGLEARLYVD